MAEELVEETVVEVEKTFEEEFDSIVENGLEEEPVVYSDEVEVEAEPEVEVAEVAEPEAEVDIWAGASDEQKTALESLQNDRNSISHRLKSDEGRVSALQRKINELEAARAAAPVQLPTVDTGEEIDLGTFEEDYPDISQAVNKLVQSKMASERQDFEAAMGQLQSQMTSAVEPFQAAEKQRYDQSQLESLNQAHPDWKAVATSTGFVDWVKIQPDAVRQMFNSDDAADAGYLVSSYKQTLPQVAAEPVAPVANNNEALQNAVTPTSRRAAPVTNSIPDDYEAAFDYYTKSKKK